MFFKSSKIHFLWTVGYINQKITSLKKVGIEKNPFHGSAPFRVADLCTTLKWAAEHTHGMNCLLMHIGITNGLAWVNTVC